MLSRTLMAVMFFQLFLVSAQGYEFFITQVGHEKEDNGIISGVVEDPRNHYDLEFNLQLISPSTRLALESMKYRVLQAHERFSNLCGVGVGSIEIILTDEDITTDQPSMWKNPIAIAQLEKQSEYLKKYAKGQFSPIVVFPRTDYDLGWAFPKFARDMLEVPENLYDSVWVMRLIAEPGFNMIDTLEHELGHLFGLLYHMNEDLNIMNGSTHKSGNQLTVEQCKVIRSSPLVHPRKIAE